MDTEIISIDDARRILGNSASQYTDTQIMEIAKRLETFADIIIDKIIELKNNDKLNDLLEK